MDPIQDEIDNKDQMKLRSNQKEQAYGIPFPEKQRRIKIDEDGNTNPTMKNNRIKLAPRIMEALSGESEFTVKLKNPTIQQEAIVRIDT